MKSYSNISKGIYKKTGEIFLDRNLAKTLYNDADFHPRNRSRILIHENTDTVPQEMIIAFTSESIVEVSTHLFPESFTMLEGTAKYIFYKESGKLLGDILLSPYSNKGNFYCFIPRNTFHRFIPYSNYSIAYELGFSNFSSELTTLYTENQFKEISAITNQQYSYIPRKIYQNRLKINLEETYDLRKAFIEGEIIYLSFDLVEELKSPQKATLIEIQNQIPSEIKENILILMPGQRFKIDKNQSLKTIAIIENQVRLTLNNKQYIEINKNSCLVYTSNLNEEINLVENFSKGISIIRFITLKK